MWKDEERIPLRENPVCIFLYLQNGLEFLAKFLGSYPSFEKITLATM